MYTYTNNLNQPLSASISAQLYSGASHPLNTFNWAPNSYSASSFNDYGTTSYEPGYSTQSYQYSETYGNGLVDAAGAVAYSIGAKRFADVANYSNEYDWGLDAISAPEVWQQGYSGKDVVVAVVDSGVDFTHEDLNDNIWYNYAEVYGDGIDNDSNGYIDDVTGWNFFNNTNNPYDNNSHGTHVAGIIAAEDNNYGITGVAYNAKIMPVKVLDTEGNGSHENIANGIIYAANNGANVINVSIGGGYTEVVANAIKFATQRGSIVVMAAGNSSGSEPIYPAALATNWGIAVGAVDSNNNMADFSNRAGSNSNLNYVVAPGVNIYSTFPDNNYEFKDGTSMAAPYVSGVAALMLSANPYLTPEEIREIITKTAIS